MGSTYHRHQGNVRGKPERQLFDGNSLTQDHRVYLEHEVLLGCSLAESVAARWLEGSIMSAREACEKKV